MQETKEKEAAELGMKNVGGVFLVLAAGLSIACVIACVERYWVARRKRVALKVVGLSLSVITQPLSKNFARLSDLGRKCTIFYP